MKKNYIIPATEIEVVESEKLFCSSPVPMGTPVGDGEDVIADAQMRIADEEANLESWGNLW